MSYKRISPQSVVEGGTGAQTLTGVLTGNGTSAVTANAITQYGTVIAGASNAVSSVAPSATSGVPYISQGAASNPAFGTAVVAGGGTGVTTMTTAYAPVCAGTTATGALQVASTGLATSGFILTSTGAGSLPTFQAPAASSITLTGDTGGGLTGNSFTFNGPTNAGKTVTFNGSGTTLSLDTSDAAANTLIGSGAGAGALSGGQSHTALGASALNVFTSGQYNVAIGTNALSSQVTGNHNTAVGTFVMQTTNGAASNCAFGMQAGYNLDTGSYNTLIGENSGLNYGTTESSNILLGYDQRGTAAESNVLRIGNATGSAAGNLNQVFIFGINGATTAGAATVPYIDSTTSKIAVTPGGAVTMNTGTQSLSISSDASATTVNIATGGAVKTTTLGSVNSTSATTVQSGSGALNVTATNGALTVNSGTGALSISSDASATTVNLATGSAAKTVTLGSVTTSSSLALKYGTSDFTLASATGTVMSALDTGEITYPLQSAFSAVQSGSTSNNTGDSSAYTVICDTELYDQNADYNNTTGIFTAPVTGRYIFSCAVLASNLAVGHTTMQVRIATTSANRDCPYLNPFSIASGGNFGGGQTITLPLTAADTAKFQLIVSGSTKTVGTIGSSIFTYFSGSLIC